MFVQRVRSSVRFAYTHIDVLAHRKQGEGSGCIEALVRCGTRYMEVTLMPEDGEVLIEAIRQAIDLARTGSVE